MKRVYIVLGEGACGKSSLIRCLTGVRQHSITWIELLNGRILYDFTVWIRSAQEAWVDHFALKNSILAMKGEYGLVCIRIHGHNGFGGADKYLTEIINAGISIESIAILTPNQTLSLPFTNNHPSIISITNSLGNPSNSNAIQVRNFWGWK